MLCVLLKKTNYKHDPICEFAAILNATHVLKYRHKVTDPLKINGYWILTIRPRLKYFVL